MEKVDLMKKEVILENRKNRKKFLILIKYIFHLLALIYASNTFLQFIGIDVPEIGCFFHVALLPWIIFIYLSYELKFCYVHRLPLYYIAVNELLTNIDYYIGIPISDSNLLVAHLLIAASLILGYSYYYLKFKLKRR